MKNFHYGNVFKIIFFILISSSILSFPVMSYTPYLEQIVGLYNIKASCEVCHLGTNLNPYGLAFEKQLNLEKDIIKALKNLERFDSDKDGFLNIDELKANTSPGDKISMPNQKKLLLFSNSKK